MQRTVKTILLSLATGLLGMFLWVFLAEGFGKVATAIVTTFYFLLMGIWLGRSNPRSLPYAGLLMNVFFGGTLLLDVMNPPSAVQLHEMLPMFAAPLLALPFSYIGVYIGTHLAQGEGRTPLPNLKAYGTGLVVGLLGLLIVYAVVLTAMSFQVASGIANTIALLVIFPVFAFLLGRRYQQKWLGLGISVCVAPMLLIGGFLFFSPTSPLRQDGSLHWPTFSVDTDAILVIILPFTLAVSCLTAYLGSRHGKAKTSVPEPDVPAGS